MVEVSDLRAGYGGIEALSGVDVSVPTGGVYAILGPNGAGKSTLLSVIAGLHQPTAGDVHIAGVRVTGARCDQLARRGVCLVPEGRSVFPNLTVRENLWLATHSGTSLAAIESAAYAAFPRLGERCKQLAGTMSGGEQQMLALARAIATKPSLVMVDELSMGLAPIIVGQLYESIAELARNGLTVIVVEQFARTVLGVAERGALMVGGRIVLEGTTEELQGALTSAYLGEGVTTS
ncbi:MAG: ABC transporter ATP-binding protein [Actinobacteria bacterium]|nr:ABC transporter ATP-binding protein [Actinomycetota bacterium]